MKAWEGDRRHAQRTYKVLRGTLGPLIRGLWRVERRGMETIPKKGPVILVTNHVSNLDPVLVVASVTRPIFHLGKHTLFTKRFRNWFFQHLGGQIPVQRDIKGSNEAAVQAAVKALQAGGALGIYPEGHRSPDGRLRRGRPGLGRLALLTGAPCYPVAVAGTHRVWPKGQKMPKFFAKTRVLVGPPRFYPKDERKAADKAECQRVTDELMADLAALLGQSYDPERALPPDDGKPQKTQNV